MAVTQGPDVGRAWRSELTTYTDDTTGVTVRQLTDSRAHDHHLYFTNPGWYDDGDRLLFGSDRTGRPNLFSVEIETGTITQLTDLPADQDARTLRNHDTYHYDGFPFLFTSVNPTKPEAYFWYGDSLMAIDLSDYSARVLWEKPAEFDAFITNVTADGETVCGSIHEAVDYRGNVMQETWEAHPTSRIIGVPTGGGTPEVYHEEANWLNHVNTSPTRSELLTFCQEGPTHAIDHRIWGLDRRTGETWKIRDEHDDGFVSHEFWLSNGEDIGFHGRSATGDPIFGVTRYDNTKQIRTAIEPDVGHMHALDRNLAVGDGSRGLPSVVLYDLHGETVRSYELAVHDCTSHVQGLHVHPRIAPDGSSVVFTSNRLGYGNVYVAEIPGNLSTLPRVEV